MTHTSLAKHHMLTWARLTVEAGESQSRLYGMDMQGLEAVLFGERGDASKAKALFAELKAEGAFVSAGDGFDLGPNFIALSDQHMPKRRTLTVSDIEPWKGQEITDLFDKTDQIGEHPIEDAAIRELLCRQAEGVLEKFEGVDHGRIYAVDKWNAFVDTGLLDHTLIKIVHSDLMSFMAIDMNDPLSEENLPAFVAALNEGIENGLTDDDLQQFRFFYSESYDRRTGEMLKTSLQGWKLAFYTHLEEDGYKRKPLKVEVRYPAVVHIKIDTEGDLLILSGRSLNDDITKALYQAHIKNRTTWFNVNCDEGKQEYLEDTYKQSGVMRITIGDVFPKPIRHVETGRISFANYGDVITQKDADYLEEQDDPDYKAGYFAIETPQFEFIGKNGLEHIAISTRSHLRKLICEHRGKSPEEADKIISAEAQSHSGYIYEFNDIPREMHLYVPYGACVDQFDAACRASNIATEMHRHSTSMMLSPNPIAFDKDTKVLDIDIEAPKIETDGLVHQ